MTKLFLTDCDGAILDFHKSFEEFVHVHYPELVLDITDYSLGLTSTQMNKIVNEFNTDFSFSKMQALGDSLEYIEKLKDELGYKFVAITTCLGTELTRSFRELNLHKLFGYDTFEEIICLPIGTSKLEALKRFEPTFYVDDKLKHCISAIKAGHTSFKMLHPYNIDNTRPDVIVPVHNWKTIYEYVISQ